MILHSIGLKRYNLLFLRGQNQRAITEVKPKTRSWCSIITITSLVRVDVVEQRVDALTVLDTKMRGTLQIENDVILNLPMTFSRILHEAWHYTDCKGDIWPTMSEIN